ncbi:MAG: transglutaminase-like domain-containing protein [Lachnospiraceae bacterium]|nr:transglutaminase-like domain-containing protein [Lachnospiraceae bacterium]
MNKKIFTAFSPYRLLYAVPILLAFIMQDLGIINTWICTNLLKEKTLSGTLQGVIYAGIIIILFFLSYLLGCLITLNRQTKLAGIILILGSLILLMFFKMAPHRITVSSLLTVSVILAADLIRDHAGRKNGFGLIFLFPYFLLLFLMISFIPISDKPLDWSRVARAFEKVTDQGKKLFSRFDFGIPDYENANIGFDGSAGLFSEVSNKKREVLSVSFNGHISGATYLTGKIYYDFNGKSWEEPDAVKTPDRVLDTIETLSAVYETYPDNIRDVLGYESLNITIKDMKTDYVFSPSKIVPVKQNETSMKMTGSEVQFNEKHRYGYSYTTDSYILNREGKDLTGHLKEISKETWNMLSERFQKDNGEIYSYEDLIDYRKQIRNMYGKKPDISGDLSEFIQKTAYTGLDGFDGSNEAEKTHLMLSNIESWLGSHDYTTDVSMPLDEIDSEEDFLRYFLFENTSGYCSYYATAFVLMARSVGIPARYVQGYRIPETDLSSVKVMSDMAHAWPEAYIEGAGWIPFEPTPGHKAPAVWGKPLMDPQYYGSGENMTDGITDLNDLSSSEYLSQTDRETDEEEYLRQQERLRQEQLLKRKIFLTVASLISGTVILIIIMIILIRLLAREVKFRKMSGKDLAAELCSRCFLVLHSLGFDPERGETIPEFKQRINRQIAVISDESDLLMFTEIYERLLYEREGSFERSFPDSAEEVLNRNYSSLKSLLFGRKKAGLLIRFFYNIITRPYYRL